MSALKLIPLLLDQVIQSITLVRDRTPTQCVRG